MEGIFYGDRMFYSEKVYQPEVRQGEDGLYRWRYQLDQYHEHKMYQLLFKILAVLSFGGLIAGLLYARVPSDVLRQYPGRYQTLIWLYRLLYAILGYLIFFVIGALIIGLIRLIEGGSSVYWYRMDENFVQIQPSGRQSGFTYFSEVKRVELYPTVNEIRLFTHWGKCPVLVRSEEYEMVKSHILTHIPANVKAELRTE